MEQKKNLLKIHSSFKNKIKSYRIILLKQKMT